MKEADPLLKLGAELLEARYPEIDRITLKICLAVYVFTAKYPDAVLSLFGKKFRNLFQLLPCGRIFP